MPFFHKSSHGLILYLIVVNVAQLSTSSVEDVYVLWEHLRFNLISVVVCSALLVFLGILYFITRPRPVYLVNFSCYKPEDARNCTRQIFMERSCSIVTFTEGNLEFQRKILERSGLGEDIYLPEAVLRVPPNPCMAEPRNMENITLNWYFGNERSMLVSNCLFRMGGAAILLSNKRSDRWRSKYQLLDTVRTHKGADDKCFTCVTQQEDPEGKIGVALSKDLMAVAGDALKTNITTLGPLVLPMSEQLLFFATLIGKKAFKMKLKPYIPDFKLAFEHFCIHAGGRAVLDELEKNLQLSDWLMEPSRMTLNRFGNTSSSSLWYELAYTEAKGRVKKGDRIWQIAFGSGFKCNSAVWRALRRVDPAKEKNPWMDEIDLFPVDVPKVSSIST